MKDWEELERAWLEESTSRVLSPLSPQFYSRVMGYLSRLRAELGASEGLRRELVEEELREATRLLGELFTLRALKAMGLSLRGEVPSSQDEGEARFFSRLGEVMEEARRELLQKEREETPPPVEFRHELLVVLGKIPRIVGEDLRYHGPFEEGEIVYLPRKTAELLVTHQLAKKLHPKRFFGLGVRE
jgi:DNA replication initiation complex subunit (GINS family)